MKTLHWKTLFNLISRRACKLIAAHNLQFPTASERDKYPELSQLETYSLAYPRRIKESEEKTIMNVLRQWCKQTTQKMTRGDTVINNIVFTNRKSARNFKRCARGTNHHLAKGVFSGCFIGEIDTETPEYQCQFTYEKGKGVGVRPWKRNHGTGKDFELCLMPALIPIEAFPKEIKFMAIDPYEETPSYVAHAWNLIKEKKTPPSLTKKETSKESMNPELERYLREMETQKKPLTDGNSEEVSRPVGSFSKLYLNGQKREAYAEMLISGYEKKLAKAMEKEYAGREIQKGYQAAFSMLKSCDDPLLDDFAERCMLTIDHMQQWILQNPQKRFVMPPSLWFDLSYPHNIAGAYKRFFKPWIDTRETWKLKKDANKCENTSNTPKSDFGRFTSRLHKRLLALHPHDIRLKKADLNHWETYLKRLNKRDNRPFSEIQAVAEWLLTSASPRAKFWREESGGFGIRSASGFRRNFGQMHHQMMQESLSKKNHLETPGRNRAKSLKTGWN